MLEYQVMLTNDEKAIDNSEKDTDNVCTFNDVYGSVRRTVALEYKLRESDFVRPFYSGDDYQHFPYTHDSVVVDNPPFSKLMEIIKFYVDNNIKFFLFAPGSTLGEYTCFCTGIAIGVDIIYPDGSVINTSFLTNLESDDIAIKSSRSFYYAVHDANDTRPEIYPHNVITVEMINKLSKSEINFEVPRSQCHFTRALDNQSNRQKASFGKLNPGAVYIVSNYISDLYDQCEALCVSNKAHNLLTEIDNIQLDRVYMMEWFSDDEREIIAKLSNHNNFD